MNNTVTNTSQRKLLSDPRTLLVLLAFCEKNIVRYVILVLSFVPGVADFTPFILPTLYTILVILSIYKGSRIRVPEIGFLFFICLLIFLTCIIYPQNVQYIFDKEVFWLTIFPCLKFFIVGLFIIPNKETLTLISKVSYISILVECVFLLAYMMPNELLESDDMSRSYQLLPNVLFVINYAIQEKKVIPILISFLGLFYILSLGTRGPIMIILAFFFIRLLKEHSGHLNTKILFTSIVGVIIIVFMNTFTYVYFLFFIKEIFNQLSLSTRIIDLAIEGTIVSYTSGRDELYALAIEKIKEKPLIGYGIYGEWPWVGWNIHNMYLELLIHFGIYFGVLFLFLILYLFFKAYFKTTNSISRDIILIWATFVFIRGIFGGSYLTFPMFFMNAVPI